VARSKEEELNVPTPRTHPADHLVTARCRRCGHAVSLDIPALAASHGDTPFVEIARRLVCRECGSRGAMLTKRYDDPRYRPKEGQ
jgi:hypothetical protein